MKTKIKHYSKKTKTFLHHSFIPGPHNEFKPKALHKKHLFKYGAFLIFTKMVILSILFIFPASGLFGEMSSRVILDELNTERIFQGLEPLQFNDKLYVAAGEKANDMVVYNYFDHFSPTGVSPWYWIKKNNYIYTYAGENLAMDFFDSEDLMKGWMNSKTHRENILNKYFKDAAIYVKKGKINNNETILVVLMFGKQKVIQAPSKIVAQINPVEPLIVPPLPVQNEPEKKVLGSLDDEDITKTINDESVNSAKIALETAVKESVQEVRSATNNETKELAPTPIIISPAEDAIKTEETEVVGSAKDPIQSETENKAQMLREKEDSIPMLKQKEGIFYNIEKIVFMVGTKIPALTKSLYMYFAIFLVAAILLNILISIKKQHVETIAGAIFLIVLSVVFALI